MAEQTSITTFTTSTTAPPSAQAPGLGLGLEPASSTQASNNLANTSKPSITTPIPAPALATTKRKFHKLLDSLTNPSTKRANATPFSPFSGVDSSAKRIRLEARSRLEAPTSPSSDPQTYESEAARVRTEARARVQAQLLRTKLEAARTTSSPKEVESDGNVGGNEGADRPATSTSAKEPNYNPWSHDGFLRRLRTFSNVRLWSPKPDEIGEVVWARKGWTCTALNTVACKGGCEQRVVVGLRPARKDENAKEMEGTEDLGVVVTDELVKRYEELVETGHDEDCLWRCRGGCKDDIYRLPIVRQSIWQPELRDRYLSFLASASSLPSNIHSLVDAEDLIHCLPPDFLASYSTSASVSSNSEEVSTLPPDAEPQPQINTAALSFALMGWSLSPDSTPSHPIATCAACFRRLGLWLYTQPPSPRDSQSEMSEAPKDLNLATQHRTHCPWINSSSQHMSGSLSGLCGAQVLSRCIENAARFRGAGRATAVGAAAAPESGVAGSINGTSGAGREGTASKPAGVKSREEQATEDKARFAKLRELTKSIGLKGLRRTLAGRRFN